MDKLIPIVLPVFFGLVAGVSHGLVSDYVNMPTSLSQTVVQPLQGQLSLE